MFVQDLPRKPDSRGSNQFKSAFVKLLGTFGLYRFPTILKSTDFDGFDWSAVTAKLLYSTPGYFGRNEPNGLTMLDTLVKTYGISEACIEYQVKSYNVAMCYLRNDLGIFDW